jgi:hypothetical protein
MPRGKNHVPSYLRHKPRNCGKVRVGARDFYLPGEFNSPESLEAYHRFVAEYIVTGKADSSNPTERTVNELIWEFWRQIAKKSGTESTTNRPVNNGATERHSVPSASFTAACRPAGSRHSP